MTYKVKTVATAEIDFDVNANSKEEAEYLVKTYAKTEVGHCVKNFVINVVETKELAKNA